MRVGDLLEIVAGVFLAVGASLIGGLGVGLCVGGLALGFEAQMYGSTPLPRIVRVGERRRWRLRRPIEQHDTAQAAA
jgi:hypothetical protein